MRILELFSGTHSIGKVAKKKGYEVISLDLFMNNNCCFGTDYQSDKHFQENIMTWNYKQYPTGYFKVITASPVCFYWSKLRNIWIGRKSKAINPNGKVVSKEDIQRDINLYGKPMVDKIFEIIKYFNPMYWWIENPATGKMKDYISIKYPQYNKFYDVDYCKYCDWGYKKTTRFWTNIENFEPKRCKNDCENIIKIKTQEGAIHSGTRKLIKVKTRIIHKSPISDNLKATENCNKNIKKKKTLESNNLDQKNIGCASNRLERYRIPEKLINEFFDLMF